MTAWNENSIASALVCSVFNRAVLAVPCCNWTGNEADLLVIEKHLRIIDVEIKISRADLKADFKKQKWWHTRPWSRRAVGPRQWPEHVWKHYYVMPANIWDNKLFVSIPEKSGVILIDGTSTKPTFKSIRVAKPDRLAKPISAADAIDIARLAGLRMWAALLKEK